MRTGKQRYQIVALLLLAAGVPTAHAADVQEAWVQRYNGPANYNDYGEDIAIDADGNTYVAGFHFYPLEENYFIPEWVLIKYQPDGTREWVRTYRSNSYAAGYEVEIDPQGRIIMAGSANFHEDWAVQRYRADGTLLWTTVYDANSIFLTNPEDLAIDGAGNSIMTGYVDDGTGPDHAPIVKVNSAGAQQWRVRYVGPEFLGTSGAAVETDSAGNIYWAGSTRMPSRSSEFGVAKFSPQGAILWQDTSGYPGSSTGDRAVDIALDSAGNVIAAGFYGFNTVDGPDLVVRKYDPQGALLWTVIHGEQQRDDVATSLTIDAQDNIIVAGYTESTPNNLDGLVVKIDPDGVKVWEYTLAGTGNDTDWFADIETDASGNSYVTGRYRPFAGFDHAVTVSLDPNGSERWLAEYIGPADGGSSASAIALDGGDVYITGRSPDPATEIDILTIKYEQTLEESPARLIDLAVLDGVIIAGGLPELETSDNAYLEVEARVTGEAHQPHLLRMRIGAATEVQTASAMTISVESRITDIEAEVTLFLRDWNTGDIVQVDQFEVGMQETMHETAVPDAARFVRLSDGRIELEVREVVILPFTLSGFHALFDQVEVVATP